MQARISNYLRLALPAFLVFWLLSAAFEIVQLYQKQELLVIVGEGRQLLADFNAFYNAGLLCRDHFQHGTPIYDVATQLSSLATVIAPKKSDVVMLSVNPPHFFLFCEPLTYFSVYHAWVLWSAMSIACLAGSIYLLDLKRVASKYEQICCALACVGTSTTFSTIRHGQNSFILLLTTLLFWRLLEARKFFLAGLSLALCLFKPQYLPALCTVGLLVGRLRFALGLIIAVSIIGVISVTAFGGNIFKSWIDFIQINGSHVDFAYMMQNIRGELTICMNGKDTDVGSLLSAIILGLGLIFMGWLWWRFRHLWSDPFYFRMLVALTISVMLFSSPHTQSSDYVLFYVTGLWGWTFIRHASVKSLPNSILRFLLIIYPYVSWIFYLVLGLFLIARIQPFLAWNLAVFSLSLPVLFTSAGSREKV
jgi:hypothetical protein